MFAGIESTLSHLKAVAATALWALSGNGFPESEALQSAHASNRVGIKDQSRCSLH